MRVMDEKDEEFVKTMETIGSKLLELRRKKGYSSHETFANDHDLPRVQYWRMESGRVNCTIKSLMKILHIHKISLAEFFQGTDNGQGCDQSPDSEV